MAPQPPEQTADALAEDLFVARGLALAAGALLLQRLGRAGERLGKGGGTEFVTESDRLAEELILAGLAERFPADRVLAEESGASGGDGARTWYVDPLDGTTNFAHGHPFFSVSIACGDADGLLLGCVYAPYLDELYLAHRGGGAVCERPAHEQLLPVGRRPEVELEAALLATGFPYVRDEVVARNTDLVRAFLEAPCHGVRRGGSAAIDLAHTAAGKLDGYWEFGLRPWDTAAGTMIAREAGCIVTDLAGAPVAVPTTTVVAAAPGLHGRMLSLIGERGEGQP